jgi:hypothetical protein
MWHRKKDNSRHQAKGQPEQCVGDCFDIKAPDNGKANGYFPLHTFGITADAAKRRSVYSSISPWQTRLIGLWPDSANAVLRADLLVVDLVAREGAVISSTKQAVFYDALSYCWGKGSRERLL